jgi:hypothetical protein
MSRVGSFFAGPIGSWVRVFVAFVVTAAAADAADLVQLDFSDWRVYLGAGIGGVLPVLASYLNGSDPRFGNVSNVPDPVSPPTNEA